MPAPLQAPAVTGKGQAALKDGRLRTAVPSGPTMSQSYPSLGFHHALLGHRQPANRDVFYVNLVLKQKLNCRVCWQQSIPCWTVGLEHRQPPASIKQKNNMYQSCTNGLSLNMARLLEEGVVWSIAELETGHGYGSDEVGTG